MFYSGKLVKFGHKWLYSSKDVVFEQKLLYSINVVVFGQKWLYSDNMVVFGNLLYSGKSAFLRENWLNSRRNICNWAKLLYLGRCGCIRAKVVVFAKFVDFG